MIKLTVIAALIAVAIPLSVSAQTTGQTVPPTAPAPAAVPAAAPATTAAVPVGKNEPSAEEKAIRAKFRAACGADIASFCADTAPVANATPDQIKAQRGKLRACLVTNDAKLSTGCKAAVVERDAMAAAKKKS